MRVTNSCIIVYITIPGIAENRPLVNIGDLLRFRFGSMEVIGEVLSLNIRNESVMIALPLPSLNENYSDLYMNALQTQRTDHQMKISIFRSLVLTFVLVFFPLEHMISSKKQQ